MRFVKGFSFSAIFLLCQCLLFAQSDPVKRSVEYAKEGIVHYEEGRYEQAIISFKKGRALNPVNLLFSYEIALSYYAQAGYISCINTLDSVMGKEGINEQFYQLLGDAYDMNGQSDSALIIFKNGLKKYPKSAALYMESGVIEFRRQAYNEAYTYWQKGIAANPRYAGNYYWMAVFYKDSTNKLPLLLYGEIYLNLEQFTQGAAEISNYLCITYTANMKVLNDSILYARFLPYDQLIMADTLKPSGFCQAMSLTFLAASSGIVYHGSGSEIGAVIAFRRKLLEVWYARKYHIQYPFPLFDYVQLLTEKGYFESYTHWLLIKCNLLEFQDWYKKNADVYKGFAEWYKIHPLEMYKKPELECR